MLLPIKYSHQTSYVLLELPTYVPVAPTGVEIPFDSPVKAIFVLGKA
jgi:hypothetical protein